MTKMEKLRNNAVYGKTMKNFRKCKNSKTSKQRKRLFKMYITTKLDVTQNI